MERVNGGKGEWWRGVDGGEGVNGGEGEWWRG